MSSKEETSDLNQKIYVAVGKNVEEGKLMLDWAVKNFEGRNIRLCLLHIHQPTSLFSLLNGKPSASKLKKQLKMQKLMDQYIVFLADMGIQADKVWIETSNVGKGILQLIAQHRISWLIMGAKAETLYPKKLSGFTSSTPFLVFEEAPASCHIWFICKGSLIRTRPAASGSDLTSTVIFSSPTDRTTLMEYAKTNMDVNSDNVQCKDPTRSLEEGKGTTSPTSPRVIRRSGDISPLSSEVEFPQYLPHLQSEFSLEILKDSNFEEKGTSGLREKLERVAADAENSKQGAFEESLRRWRAEEDALVALREAEAAERHYEEERSRNNEIEELVMRQDKEILMMKNQQRQFMKELEIIKNRKPALEIQLREACFSEKELEDKIVQAVNLLVAFKETRNRLQIEYDSAIREVNRYSKLHTTDPTGISSMDFFGISFSEIIEATQNFSPSQRIGEGRYGNVFKGMLCHVKVAIKMLPSSGSQSDSDFKHEVEVVSRVRHPNLVTLIGACPESRALIYEYIDNGSLEDYLSDPAKARLLSWQTRIRIAIDICSTLLFLNGNSSCRIHGNLKPTKILLDANFVSHISGFGIHDIISINDHTFSLHKIPEFLAYMDPEALETGDLTTESDIYSYGMILLRLLTCRPATGVIRDVKCALESGQLDTVLDISAGEWPLEQAKQLADLALRCCEKDRSYRPDIVSGVWCVLQPMREFCNLVKSACTQSSDSRSQRKMPSHFVCPIFQEVMKDPQIAADGFTYEGDAISGWFNSGHKTSPMTNLKLENCDLLPNYALYYAIQEWEQNT